MDKDPHTSWEDDEGLWWTDYPPPVDFDGEEKGDYGDFHDSRTLTPADQAAVDAGLGANLSLKRATAEAQRDAFFAPEQPAGTPEDSKADTNRSKEHTYELQSLMSITYDIFCFKKK